VIPSDHPPCAWKPRLAAKARLRRDAVGGQDLLLFPEAALALNETAAAIVRLCDGSRDVDAIVHALAADFAAPSTTVLGTEVRALLATLRRRGLLE
jgi:pyrroloquinoline quinone biosynthesis protein D